MNVNILRPELAWVEGRCYRVYDSTTDVTSLQEHDLYDNDVMYDNEQNDSEDDNYEVTMIDNSRYATKFHVPKNYLGSVIGKKGATRFRIEKETNTSIKIPRQGESGDITILGSTATSVKTARRRVNMVVMSSRMKQRPTHFLSIPLNNEEIKSNFRLFKEKVLSECSGIGIEEKIFIKPEKLHLTLGVMCLMDNEERLQASKLLTEAKETVIMPVLRDHLPLKIRVKGLSYMNDDPSQIKVLYANVNEEGWTGLGVLQTLGDSIARHFDRAGFLKNEHGRDSIKLHVTLMNSRYRYDDPTGDTAETKPPRQYEPFDGSDILKNYTDFDFGAIELKEMHLSQMHTEGTDGFYQSTCVISFAN